MNSAASVTEPSNGWKVVTMLAILGSVCLMILVAVIVFTPVTPTATSSSRPEIDTSVALAVSICCDKEKVGKYMQEQHWWIGRDHTDIVITDVDGRELLLNFTEQGKCLE